MINFIIGLLTDASLLGGIILFGMSFSQRFKQHQTKLIICSLVFIAAGLLFLDYSALSEAYQNGAESAKATSP